MPGLGWLPDKGGMLRATVDSVEERDEEQEDEGEEELRDGGVPFYVNRGGLPVDEETWERMWRHVARIHPGGEALAKDIRSATDHPKVKLSVWKKKNTVQCSDFHSKFSIFTDEKDNL